MLGLPERGLVATIDEYWMLRIVHVERALLERGYPELDAAIDLHVTDGLLQENTGTYALRVEAGQPHLVTASAPGTGGSRASPIAARGGVRRALLTVSALAALYGGLVTPSELALNGQLEADEPAQATLATLFGGPTPACVDYFRTARESANGFDSESEGGPGDDTEGSRCAGP